VVTPTELRGREIRGERSMTDAIVREELALLARVRELLDDPAPVGDSGEASLVKELTRLILSKPGVDKVAVIMNVVSNTRVDMMARGIVKGILESGKNPAQTVAVFRVPGACEDEGKKILSK
jgi:succinyl-CoA synthetase beta subunit